MPDDESPLSFESDRNLARSLDGVPRVDILGSLRHASRAGRKPGVIAREIWQMMSGPGALHPNEYFYYGLHGDDLSETEKRRFVGKNVQGKLHTKCNDMAWRAVADNKQLFYAAMKGYGFPVPETVAVFSTAGLAWPGRTLRSREQLVDFLRDAQGYPLFAKPVDGIYSVGTLGIASVAADDDVLVLTTGERLPIGQCADYMSGISEAGYLFQVPLSPHQQLQQAFGTATLPTVRFLVAVSGAGAEVISAVCKIPAQGNMADNFWRRGNMLGAIAPDSGEVLRVVCGTGLDAKELREHPDTHRPIQGMVLPDWQEAKAICLSAAATLPGIRTQSWDIALSDAGPTIIETNWGGDLNLHQLAHRRGILQDAYLSHLRRCGCKVKL